MQEVYHGYQETDWLVLHGNVFPAPFPLLVYNHTTPVEKGKIDAVVEEAMGEHNLEGYEYQDRLMKERIKATMKLLGCEMRIEWVACVYASNGSVPPLGARCMTEKAGWLQVLKTMETIRSNGGESFKEAEIGH